MTNMTEATHARIPHLTLGWRLKMALGDITAQDMADHLGVSRGTVSRWMADKGAPPKRVYILQWALLTDTAVEWLETGRVPADGPGDQVSARYSNLRALVAA